ncbi:MAG: nucleotidyltransferase [Fimbriimonas sp.]
MQNAPPSPQDLSEIISVDTWAPYAEVIDAVEERGLRYCLGGGIAFSAYSYRKRFSKDIDLFILQTELEKYHALMKDLGFTDYFEEKPYDRSWLYRGYRDGVVLDLIWSLPNHRMRVEDDWFEYGRHILVHGKELPLIPLVELIRSKIYVLQSDRTDWPDLINILYQEVDNISWETLVDKMQPDELLLASLLAVFVWLRPEFAEKIPNFVWDKTGLKKPSSNPVREDRVNLLDTRHWFGPGYSERR